MKTILVAAALAAVFVSQAQTASTPMVEVVVTMDAPPLATAVQQSRVFSARTKAQRLSLATPFSASYVRSLETAQHALAARITTRVPGSRITWRYQVVLDGLAVYLPRADLARLAATPGVAQVWPNVAYRPLLDKSPGLIGAPLMWSADFSTAGNGIKIGIVDDGVDQAHPFFGAGGYTMPAGFPKGQMQYTTPKVIAARAFSPPNNHWKYANTPFDPQKSEHATHVAGIAAGNYSPGAIAGRGPLSGVAPRAYLGNYKVLTYPTENFGLNGNAPEIAAGVEAAVKDGMDVINLSLGEAEIEPSRDLVVTAINAAADAGVVPAIAAGNDYEDFGDGSVGSPGSARKAITAAAVTKQLLVASFSSGGPTPVSLEMKPDVSAPGVDITSSVPPSDGSWASFSGTSMATPHVAGAVALLLQRHPDWTVAQVKSALVLTGKPVVLQAGRPEAPTTREGGGIIYVPAANDPKIFAAPTDLSFGLLKPGAKTTASVDLTDAGGGAGAWTVALAPQGAPAGATVQVPPGITVPGRLTLTAVADRAEGDATGFVVLQQNGVSRRIPYWFRVSVPKLAAEKHTVITAPGNFTGRTTGKPSHVSAYRYPASPSAVRAPTGPEQVYRFTLKHAVANFGVAVTAGGEEPFVVYGGDENRLTGYAGLPLVINPYIDSYGTSRLVAGAIRPAPGTYDIVLDTPAGRTPGPFAFHFWVNDVTPPAVHLLTPVAKRNTNLRLAVTDAGSGVDPLSLTAAIDGKTVDVTYKNGRALVPLLLVARGKHRLVFSAADYQELKNMENVPQILPNTRNLAATFTVR